jgi:hypothetical protein
MDTLHIIRNSKGYVMDTLHIIRNSKGYVMDTLHILLLEIVKVTISNNKMCSVSIT